MHWIEQGHFLLPWFEQPPRDPRLADGAMKAFVRAYEGPIKIARGLKLPITLVGPQWEECLSRDPYLGLPPDQNPNVVTKEGKVLPELSPFGPVQSWRELGRTWTDDPQMRLLQQWYPDPPLVIFLSNNEAPKLRWAEVEKDRRYLETYGEGRDDHFRAKAVGDGWIARYRAFQAAMREGLTSRHWRQKAIFVGYDAFGPPHFR
jgi:hypothetical protein